MTEATVEQRSFRENALFRGNPNNWPLNACVGDNGGPYDLYDYAQGYLECSRLLIESAKSPAAIVDTLVYPACYNFRHGIELYVKYGIECVAAATDEDLKYGFKHTLTENWTTLRTRAENLLDLDPADVNFVDQTIICFDEVDPNGQIFRYPESIKGIQHLKEWSLINLGRVGCALERITAIFKDWHYLLEGELAAKREVDAFERDGEEVQF